MSYVVTPIKPWGKKANEIVNGRVRDIKGAQNRLLSNQRTKPVY